MSLEKAFSFRSHADFIPVISKLTWVMNGADGSLLLTNPHAKPDVPIARVTFMQRTHFSLSFPKLYVFKFADLV